MQAAPVAVRPFRPEGPPAHHAPGQASQRTVGHVIASTYLIALGIVLLIPVRLSAAPGALGLLVVVATLLIAAACATHLAVIMSRIRPIPPPLRASLVGAAWLGSFAGATWAMSRGPGSELVLSLIVVPPLVGVAGVVSAPSGRRWGGVPFLALAIGLAFLVLPIWLERLNG